MSGTQEQEPLTITVEAKDLSIGDWVVPEGLVKTIHVGTGNNAMVSVIFEDDGRRYLPNEKVEVRLEDHGETS